MRRWSELADRVAATSRTSEKRRLIAENLRSLPPDDLVPTAHFLAGRPFAQGAARATGVGWATIAGVVTELSGLGPDALRAAYDRSSDLGTAVGEVLAEAEAIGTRPIPAETAVPTPAETAAAFAALEAAPGPARKGALLRELLARVDPRTAKYLVRILAGELRIGLREGLLEAAVADAFARPLAAVKRAGMLTGDVGETARLAREDRLDEAALGLFRPITFMLASPGEDAAAIVARLGPTVWVEDKYDGIRAQLHRRGEEVRLYSRDLRDVSEAFPELVEAARPLAWDGILDGEILAVRDGVVLPFLALQGRLGRKRPSAELLAEVPVVYVAFDLLAQGPRGERVEPALELPLRERRRRLEGLALPAPRFARSNLTTAASAGELEARFAEARGRRNEGLMVKDPASVYSPGRRGLGWLKLKKALATLDCVVVGVEVGHGKRHGVLSDYTFAVRDEARGALVTIGKAYTGLTDAELAEWTRWFEAHTLERHGRYRVVEPTVVVEVAFDVLMRSSRHRSGFALRFPRIVRIRDDKPAAEIDTLATVEALFVSAQAGAEHLVTMGAAGRPRRSDRSSRSD
jgi:DNA ligase-1